MVVLFYDLDLAMSYATSVNQPKGPLDGACPAAAPIKSDQRLLYNSRITAVYVEYLDRYYPEIDIDRLLADAGMNRLQIEDQAHWFTQAQVDRFNRLLIQKTRDPHISHAVGRFAASSQRLGAIKKYILGFIQPASVYLLFDRYHALASRGATTASRRTGPNKVEIVATPLPGVREQPYQCENRMGTIESIGTAVTHHFAKVLHPQCIHRGDPLCRYEVTWENTVALWWKRIQNFTLLMTLILSVGAFLFLPAPWWLITILALACVTSTATAYAYYLENEDLRRTISAQGDVAEEHMHEIHTRYNNNLLIHEIGQATATAMDEEGLFHSVVAAMQNRLDFDRGLLLLADQNQKYLRYGACYGFDPQKEKILRRVTFHLDKPESKGVFVRSFREQAPFIVDDIQGLKEQFSAKSQRLVDRFGAHSLICVPIIFENEALGILAVDTIVSRRKLLQTDLNLLMGIASHLAVSINNARFYQKLRASEEKYRDIFENVSDFLYFHDMEGRILNANFAFQKATGYKQALTGLNIRELLTAQFRNRLDAYLLDVQRCGHAEGVIKLRRRNGSTIVVEYKNSLVFDEGTPIGVRGSARDITERWRARREKKRLEEQLARAQKMEAVGTLAGGVAHDLNNVLTGIVSYPEIMLMDLPPDSPLCKPLEVIQDSGQKAAAIVQDLLTMARRGVTVAEVVNLNDVLNDYLNSPGCTKLRHHYPGVAIQTELDADLLNMLGSPVHLFKTMMNLVTNAAEAMPDGGTVTITSANRYVDAPIRGYDVVSEGDYIVLTVTDTGTGISEQDCKRIFEPFYTKKVMGRSGTGLGMSVVWAAVKDHHGYVDIASEVGQGTTVTIYFPATRQQARSQGFQRAIEDYRGDGESILVIDDIQEQRAIAQQILSRLGYRVATAPSGEAALPYLEEHPVHLVVLDMIMPPGMDGLETYRKIKERYPQQKAIIVSGFSESDRVKQTQALGAGAYVKKPYLIETIGQAVLTELTAGSRPN